ncbi:MAG: SDR family oxidoreductase [Flavobacteriaceae bacterium]|nr:SDR family oxidoreductase [Flavobacteriaceae bacterium]
MSKVVLVTGGSSGIGRSICEFLHEKGFKVYGTSRNPEKYPDSKVELLELDVNDITSINFCLEELMTREDRLDILINNAGAGITGPVEEIPGLEIRKNFDTNFFGPLNLMKGAIPVMRQQNAGIIINITSIAAYIGLPYRGVYSAGKAALELIVEAVRMEVKEFNIKIANIAPGDFATNIASGRYHEPVHDESPYSESYGKVLRAIDEDVDAGNDPMDVAKLVYRIINTAHPKPHYLVGAFMQKFSIRLKRILPQKWFEKLLLRHHKL